MSTATDSLSKASHNTLQGKFHILLGKAITANWTSELRKYRLIAVHCLLCVSDEPQLAAQPCWCHSLVCF